MQAFDRRFTLKTISSDVNVAATVFHAPPGYVSLYVAKDSFSFCALLPPEEAENLAVALTDAATVARTNAAEKAAASLAALDAAAAAVADAT